MSRKKKNREEFAQSLDTLKAKSQQLKNSIGASIAPMTRSATAMIYAVRILERS